MAYIYKKKVYRDLSYFNFILIPTHMNCVVRWSFDDSIILRMCNPFVIEFVLANIEKIKKKDSFNIWVENFEEYLIVEAQYRYALEIYCDIKL